MKKLHETNLCATCESRSKSVFHNFPTDQLDKLEEGKMCFHFKKGDLIFYEGNHPQGIYCVKKGKIKIYKTGYEGKEQIIKFAKDGDIVGYRSLLSGEKYNTSAACLDDTVVCFIPRNHLFDLIQEFPCVPINLMKVACHELGEAGKFITNLAQKSTRERLAEVLLILKDNFGEDEIGALDVKLSREEIANMVGTATESTIRLLAEFQAEHLIRLEGKKIIVTNPDGLVRIAKIAD